MIDNLISIYAAWLIAAAVPIWFISLLYRTTRNTINAGRDTIAEEAAAPTPLSDILAGDAGDLPPRPDHEPGDHANARALQEADLPPRPAHEPTIHLPVAA